MACLSLSLKTEQGAGEAMKLIHMLLLTGLIGIYTLLFLSVPVAQQRTAKLSTIKGGSDATLAER